jgi:peptidoglycan hydrolase CwlO-like protein
MGLFKKKEKESKKKEVSSLPELPRLPDFPERASPITSIPQLPSFPMSSLGEKFSQNTIKEAVTGKKEDEEVFDADEFAETEEDMRMMPKPLGIRRFGGEPKPSNVEPVFIRIDKFEESLQIFEKTKKQILEIENMLKNIQKIKDEEEKELEYWENEINSIKGQIEKVDKDIFSKID